MTFCYIRVRNQRVFFSKMTSESDLTNTLLGEALPEETLGQVEICQNVFGSLEEFGPFARGRDTMKGFVL